MSITRTTDLPGKAVCERCGEIIDKDTAVWLELNSIHLSWHKAGEVPQAESQGFFAFGAACAKKMLALRAGYAYRIRRYAR